MADWRRKTRLFRACCVRNRLVCSAVSRPKCIRHTGNEVPPPRPPDSVPQGSPDGRTMVTACGGWAPSKAEKDILILETNGNSSVVEAHRLTYYRNRPLFSSPICGF